MASIGFGPSNSGFQIGSNEGKINAHFYASAPERPETSPSPLSTVPFRRDPDFIKHGTLLEQISEKTSAPGSRVAVIGLGGVGKSQLAIEYAYRLRIRSPTTWVFWIHASNATRFEQSCREIAERVKIPGRRNCDANILQLLQDWLHDREEGEWLLIFDNLDDDSFLHQPLPARQGKTEDASSGIPERTIWEYFPENLPGSILVTSRSRDVVTTIVEDRDIIVVEPMDEKHATALLAQKVAGKVQFQAREAAQLTAVLDYMPLAIVQAAAYIKQRAPRVSVPQYLEDLQKSDHNKLSLLSREGRNLRRDREARNAIFLTWQITFDHLRNMRRTAADLLALMSFFDRQGIPEIVLRDPTESNNNNNPVDAPRASKDNDNGHDGTNSIDIFEDDIVALRNYSLINISTEGTTFTMHRLIQLAIQEWLRTQEQLKMWKVCFIQRLCALFPEDWPHNFPLVRLLFPHVKYSLIQMPENSIQEWATLLRNAGNYATWMGDIGCSMRMTEIATETMNKLYGLEDERTLDCIEAQGQAYYGFGQWDEAAKFQTHALCALEGLLGAEHLRVSAARLNLARTYRRQARFPDAERLTLLARDHFERTIGKENSHYLSASDYLVSIYQDMGRLREAEELSIETINISKRVHGSDDPGTRFFTVTLASMYFKQGRLEDAEELLSYIVDEMKLKLGAEHTATMLTCMAILSLMYRLQGRAEQAEQLRHEVLDISKKVFGPDYSYFKTLLGEPVD
ncbi:P-loop containing nucleoside triphosphate hydrolase protein [Penicillium cataractarum]|uniref:P-loop containing nucleoside triphosphate hydrolase protein n=1 Tax=Penicillium cataractarum TaxID=2100454 RepID=A0A9W9RZ20_9EURO|nr:P-loop containing nucleoside triphosphate hydrolase protein [Penicillium cataractarum]KAJ5368856.1 P-loop containing nucleoside triphosphate hydrolase protein [Penicillium cataractarum]